MNEEEQRKHAQRLMRYNPYFAEESEWVTIIIAHTDLECWRLFLEYAKQTSLAQVQWEVFYSDIAKQAHHIEHASKPRHSITLKVSITDAAWVLPLLKAFIEANGGHTALRRYLEVLDKPNHGAFIDEIRRIYVYGWSFVKFASKIHQGMT